MNKNDATEWKDQDVGSVSFKYDIEKWLSDPINMREFKTAIQNGGNQYYLGQLPYWVAVGARKLLKIFKTKDQI